MARLEASSPALQSAFAFCADSESRHNGSGQKRPKQGQLLRVLQCARESCVGIAFLRSRTTELCMTEVNVTNAAFEALRTSVEGAISGVTACLTHPIEIRLL